MTSPGLPPLFDAGNASLNADLAAVLVIGKILIPGGEKGVATIRQANTTISLAFDKAEAEKWAALFTELAGMLSGSGIAVANSPGLVAGVNGQVR